MCTVCNPQCIVTFLFYIIEQSAAIQCVLCNPRYKIMIALCPELLVESSVYSANILTVQYSVQ